MALGNPLTFKGIVTFTRPTWNLIILLITSPLPIPTLINGHLFKTEQNEWEPASKCGNISVKRTGFKIGQNEYQRTGFTMGKISIKRCHLFNIVLLIIFYMFNTLIVLNLKWPVCLLYSKGIESLSQTLISQSHYLCNPMSKSLDISNYEDW